MDRGHPRFEHVFRLWRHPAEALAELEVAKAAWREAATKNGRPIPEPKYRPLIYQAAY
jgi:hypothetical protein